MSEPSPPSALIVRDLGRMPYAGAYEIQRRLQQEVIESRPAPSSLRSSGAASSGAEPRGGHLLLVITISRRKTAKRNLVATPEQLAAVGVEVHQTDRGGDITYHGPGQLVVYPILDLNVLHLRLHGYMRFLEQIVIDTLAAFGIAGHRDPEATGVWVKRQNVKTSKRRNQAHGLPSVGSSAKICAMGVRVSRWVSMHGLALNVTTNLAHFDLIVPCGLTGRSVMSMAELLGEACPPMEEVKRVMIGRFEKAIAERASGRG
jgi:lipoyl(octanoyl) transferase